MKSERVDSQSPDVASPVSNNSSSGGIATEDGPQTAIAPPSAPPKHDFPPPKTDKPRPHVCQTCTRSFARLEHLKRHERSHTKEKPFECPECTRCFARRDLLLRHQQKLHYQNTTSSRPRNGRRESLSGPVANKGGRVRKHSIANSSIGGSAAAQNGARPRANTLGHLDLASLGLLDGVTSTSNRVTTHALHHPHAHRMSMSGLPGPGNFDYRGMSTNMFQHNTMHGLPKIETHSLGSDMHNSLRTAPPQVSGFGGFQLDQLFPPGTTINPAQLHFGGSAASPASPFQNIPPFPPFGNTLDVMEQEDDFSWIRAWDASQMNMGANNENAIEESSPSRISSSASQNGFTDSAMDMQHNPMHTDWSSNDLSASNGFPSAPFQFESLGTGLPNLDPPQGTISPQHLHDSAITGDAYFNNHMIHGHDNTNGLNTYGPSSLSNFGSDSPSMSSSMTGSARQSSVSSVSTDSITDATRQALLISLSQPSVFGHNHRKYSQPSISSPLSPGVAMRTGPSLPSTSDLQRYVNAYINYFHPHMPFLHIPTLSFDSPDYISNLRSAGMQTSYGHAGIIGGGGCLILAMAAIGALYEYDHQASRDLFDAAKKMIQLYLEERRKADMSAAVNGSYVSAGNSLKPCFSMSSTVTIVEIKWPRISQVHTRGDHCKWRSFGTFW